MPFEQGNLHTVAPENSLLQMPFWGRSPLQLGFLPLQLVVSYQSFKVHAPAGLLAAHTTMPLLDLHTILTGAAVKHPACPHCGGDMYLHQEKQRLGLWCRLLMRTPNIHRYYHCGTCGWHYGLVKLAEDQHEPS